MTTPRNTPGHDGPKCGALKRDGSGKTCTLPAGWGTPTPGVAGVRCKLHGGATRTHQVAARRTAAEEAAVRFGIPVETSAENALQAALNAAEGLVMYYRARLQELPPDRLIGGVDQVRRVIKHPGGPDEVIEETSTVRSRPHVLLDLLDRAEMRRVQIAKVMAELGIEARRAAFAKEQGALWNRMLLMVLARYDVADDDPDLPGIIAEVIAELEPGA